MSVVRVVGIVVLLSLGACSRGGDAPGAPGPKPGVAAAAVPLLFAAPPPVGTKALCPIMKDEFTVTATTLRSTYQGQHVAFCCDACKAKFDADPAKYVKN
jgi:YHS domain-containing protein